MKVNILSLSGHRIDELLADYAHTALKNHDVHEFHRNGALTDKTFDALWVFNGLHDTQRSTAIVNASKKIPTLYFHDDISLPTFPSMTTISQFEGMSNHHFQISELAVFDKKWEKVPTAHKGFDFCYWGHKKPEREKNYDKYIYPMDRKTSMFIGDFKGNLSLNIAYERDMNRLHKYISHSKFTVVFGDKHHNGKSIPLRVYEAAMNGVSVLFDKDLVENQAYFTINPKFVVESNEDFFIPDYEEFKTELLKGTIEDARERVLGNLETLLEITSQQVRKKRGTIN